MLQLYSDKTNVTDKTQVYPIKVALLNLDYGCKRKHLGTLALIPVLKHLPSCSDADMAVARRDLLRQVLAIVTQTLRDASHTGLQLELADGVINGFPRCCSYVADYPEAHCVCQIRSGVQATSQCIRCFMLTEYLADVHTRAGPRTLAAVRSLQAAVRAAPTAEAREDLCRQAGIHPQDCGHLGFAGEDGAACECCACEPDCWVPAGCSVRAWRVPAADPLLPCVLHARR